MKTFAPICLFTYNRLSETQQTVAALQKNDFAPLSDLFIFSDAAKELSSLDKVMAVRDFIKSIDGFKSVSIFEASKNKGLANAIIDGVSRIITEYGKVIVLEDDLITRPNFLEFMNQGLHYYEKEKKIQSVNGFSLNIESAMDSVYFQQRPFPWGWATWEDRWDISLFDKESLKEIIKNDQSILKKFKNHCGEDVARMLLNSIHNRNDSWYIRWVFNHFTSNKFSVYPLCSLVSNIGFGNEGTHCKGINPYKSSKKGSEDEVLNFIDYKKTKKKITQDFLRYFTKKYRLLIRFQLLRSREGRALVKKEIKSKVFGV